MLKLLLIWPEDVAGTRKRTASTNAQSVEGKVGFIGIGDDMNNATNVGVVTLFCQCPIKIGQFYVDYDRAFTRQPELTRSNRLKILSYSLPRFQHFRFFNLFQHIFPDEQGGPELFLR